MIWVAMTQNCSQGSKNRHRLMVKDNQRSRISNGGGPQSTDRGLLVWGPKLDLGFNLSTCTDLGIRQGQVHFDILVMGKHRSRNLARGPRKVPAYILAQGSQTRNEVQFLTRMVLKEF